MEDSEQKGQSQNLENAVISLVNDNDREGAIKYLRENPNDISEFCIQLFEAYREGDRTGIYQLAKIIKELLPSEQQ